MSDYYAIAPYSSELYHHGVKGQKWGVRRFQNADGTLTAAGKKREAKNEIKQARNEILGKGKNKLVADVDKAREHVQKAAALVGKEQANKILKSSFGRRKLRVAVGAVGLTAGAAAANAILLSSGYYSVKLVLAVPMSAVGGAKAVAANARYLDDMRELINA